MDKNFNDIVNSISDIEPPKHLKQAIFQCIEKEKQRSITKSLLWLRVGTVASVAISILTGIILGREIFSSEFASLALLGVSDLKIVMPVWQDYALSLLETLPTVSIAVVLLPVFVFMLLLRQYAKLEQYNQAYLLKN